MNICRQKSFLLYFYVLSLALCGNNSSICLRIGWLLRKEHIKNKNQGLVQVSMQTSLKLRLLQSLVSADKLEYFLKVQYLDHYYSIPKK